MIKTRLAILAFLMAFTQTIYSQTTTVTGVVSDDTGTPLPGVTVQVVGQSNGTTTDFDGNYSVGNVSSTDQLTFSYVGMAPKTVTVAGQSKIDISLISTASSLDEVVVTGYSKQSTRDITGSVSVVKAEDLAATAPTTLEQALQGQASGVVVGSEGGPGGKAAVRIRGFGTINSNDPLYIIDGTPSGQGLNDLNPNDIESIQVLKDASSAAIYGNRAGNGVVIVTTKSGKKSSSVQFNANVYTGVDFIPESVFPELASPQQVANALFKGFVNDGVAPSNAQFGSGTTPVLPNYLLPQGSAGPGSEPYSLENNRITKANKEGTDWFDAYFNSAITQNYNVSATGGSDKSNFFTSISYLNQEGVALHTGFDRFTLRANSSFDVTDKFRMGENISVSYSEQILPPGNSEDAGTIAMLYRSHPLIPIRDEGGNFAGVGVGGLGNATNPIAIATRNKDDQNVQFRALGNFFGELDLFKDFTYKSNVGFDIRTLNQFNFQPQAWEGESPQTITQFSELNQLERNYVWFNTLTYDKEITSGVNLNALAGTEFRKENFRQLQASRTGFLVPDVPQRFINNGTGANNANGFGWKRVDFSVFGKVDVNILDRYLLSGTIRRDATSNFIDENRVGYFPSFSAGWRVSNESFLEGSEVLNNLMFKVGYGTIGNANIGASDKGTTLQPNVENFFYTNSSYSSAIGFGINYRGNPNISLETTKTFNVGFTSRWIDALTFDFEVYDANTVDMLFKVPGDPTILGFTNTVPFNFGEMNNKGFDLSLGYDNGATTNAFQYSISGNISAYKNEVTTLNSDNPDAFINGDQLRDQRPSRTAVGQPLASFYGKTWEGLDADGRVIFAKDADGNVIRDFIGSPHPDFTYGINFSAYYKNFDFALFFQGIQGNEIYNFNKFFIDFDKFPGAKSLDYVNESGGLPKLTQNSNTIGAEAEPSTHYVEDGSYFRLKNIVLGYSLPKDMISKTGLSRVRLYLQGKNLLTFTKYTGLDPEINLRNFDGDRTANLTIGVDSGTYPINRSVIFGLNVSF